MTQRLALQRDGVTTILTPRLDAIVRLLLAKSNRIEKPEQGAIQIDYAGNSVTLKITEVCRTKTDQADGA